MKTLATLVPLLLLVMPVPALAQFEGVIDMKITRNIEGSPKEILYSMSVKENMLAAHVNGADERMKNTKFIFRGDQKLMWVINDENKSYMEIPLGEDSTKSKKTRDDAGHAKAKINLRKTGKTETILGYACNEWVTDDTGKVTHIWGTSKLGNVYEGLMKSFQKMSFHRAQSMMRGWEGELANMKLFPLRIVSTEGDSTTETQEVTKIEPKSLDASLFEAPAGYKQQSLGIDMGKMMEQMQGRHGLKGDSAMSREDLQKMMKEMQEKFKKEQKDSGDSSKE